MFGWLFGNKKEVERVEEDTKKSFELVKKDINSISAWIKHLDSEKNLQKKEIEDIKEALYSINSEVEGIKNVISIMGNLNAGGKIKNFKQLSNKQTAVQAVQTAV